MTASAVEPLQWVAGRVVLTPRQHAELHTRPAPVWAKRYGTLPLLPVHHTHGALGALVELAEVTW